LTDRLWGEGFTTPGGAEYVIDFIQRLDLSEKTWAPAWAVRRGP
jgi:hypothetical protein